MANKIDKLKIEGTMFDRRRKLTPLQYKEIRELHGTMSANKTARMYCVSKRLVQFIWDPDKRAENVKRRRERGKQYSTRKELSDAVRNLRRYKRRLVAEGLLSFENKGVDSTRPPVIQCGLATEEKTK